MTYVFLTQPSESQIPFQCAAWSNGTWQQCDLVYDLSLDLLPQLWCSYCPYRQCISTKKLGLHYQWPSCQGNQVSNRMIQTSHTKNV